MKRKKISKLVGLLGAACLSLGVFVSPAATLPAQAAAPSEAQPYSDIIEYVYKIENGHIYKILYNFSTGVYIGDWIYVGEWTGPGKGGGH